MNALLSAAAVGPLVVGWPVHAWRLRRRIESARRDPLSGLLTRVPFEERAGRMSQGGGVSVVFIDLDGFKALNDRHGHAAGDAVIRETGTRLEGWMHVHGPGAAARLGGDEFAAAVRAHSVDELVWSAGDLYDALCEPVAFEGHGLPVGASVGAVWSPNEVTVPLPVLLRRADEAMYAAKTLGGGSCITDCLHPEYRTVNGRRAGRPGASRAVGGEAR